MLVARLYCLRDVSLSGLHPVLTQSSPALRTSCLKAFSPLLWQQQRLSKEQLKEVAFEPVSKKKIKSTGCLAVGGVVGALCYYGLVEPIKKAGMWPQYVKDRIHSTYMYFAGSLGLTALSAVAVSRTPALLELMSTGSWVAVGARFAVIIGAVKLVRPISYENNPRLKHLAWMLHAGVIGAVIAPLRLLGGPLLMHVAWYTAGIAGALSTVAMCAPSEMFLNMGGPLAMGFWVVFASTISFMILPPTSALSTRIYSVTLYGSVILFSMFLLYDTQKVIKRAETHPLVGVQKYDPINASMEIHKDILDVFMKLIMVLADDGREEREETETP